MSFISLREAFLLLKSGHTDCCYEKKPLLPFYMLHDLSLSKKWLMEPHKLLKRLQDAIDKEIKVITVQGLDGAARSFFLASFLGSFNRTCLILAPEQEEASRIFRQLHFFLSEQDDNATLASAEPSPGRTKTEKRLFQFPAYDISPLSGFSPHPDIINQRLEALYQLLSSPNPVVVSCLEAAVSRTIAKAAMLKSFELLEAGEEFNREELVLFLESGGYNRTSLVEEKGDYTVRGSILDIFPPLHPYPVRLEFWGDTIESIRYFDPQTQRSLEPLKELVLIPCCEVLTGEKYLKKARSMGRLPSSGAQGQRFPGIEGWLNHFYDDPGTLLDFAPPESLLILIEPHRFSNRHDAIRLRFDKEVEEYRKEASRKGLPFPETDNLLVCQDELQSLCNAYQQLHFGQMGGKQSVDATLILSTEPVRPVDHELDLMVEGKGRISMAPLAERVCQWANLGGCVILVTRTEGQAQRLVQILSNYKVQVAGVARSWCQLVHRRGIFVCVGKLTRGFIWPSISLFVITEDEIFGPKKPAPRAKATQSPEAIRWSSISQLKEGDLVVHEDHGIGAYGGLFKMEVGGKQSDFLLIRYADNDKLYIPADRIGILQKYVGADDKEPKLDRLGGRSWKVAKQKAKRSIREIAKQLVDLYALRTHRKGYAFSPPDTLYKEFEATFQHEETPDQTKAIEEVLKDMTSERPMDRLICGDVGFGKTEVALRAAFKAVCDGKQVAMLVPTTVLAEQHFDTFCNRMKPYGIRVGLLSRFKSRKEQAEILAALRSGGIDIIIGTHRLLQKDVVFSNLGLLIIDEEQRFGVKQKEALKRYRALVDVLALTATPIPRTLQLSLTGIRDLSIIETPPEDRLSIQTIVSAYDESLIVRAIQTELERGGQVFYVHNRVRTIDNCALQLRNLVPFAKISVAHGQMKEKELEKTMLQFLKKEIDVLVCSTIIESGLDIPTANTIIITEVERLGLSQIYQLRGRVGRSREKAYAYLLFSKGARMTKDAEKRLKALMDFSHLGAGLQLAMHDLKIRGGGNILGFAQSGHISSIGYELYLKLVEQAIAELKGEQWEEIPEPEISLPVPARLSERYIGDMDIRLNLYRRLSTVREEEQLYHLREELRDRFGPLPYEVDNLLQLVRVRLILRKLGISRLDASNSTISITFAKSTPLKPDRLVKMVAENAHRMSFTSTNRLKIRMPNMAKENLLKHVLNEIQGLVQSA